MYRLADAQRSATKVPVVRDLRLSVVANPKQHGAGFMLFQISHLECMAGTTGLEPATSAVTAKRKVVTYRNKRHGWLLFGAVRCDREPLSNPYQTHDLLPCK